MSHCLAVDTNTKTIGTSYVSQNECEPSCHVPVRFCTLFAPTMDLSSTVLLLYFVYVTELESYETMLVVDWSGFKWAARHTQVSSFLDWGLGHEADGPVAIKSHISRMKAPSGNVRHSRLDQHVVARKRKVVKKMRLTHKCMWQCCQYTNKNVLFSQYHLLPLTSTQLLPQGWVFPYSQFRFIMRGKFISWQLYRVSEHPLSPCQK